MFISLQFAKVLFFIELFNIIWRISLRNYCHGDIQPTVNPAPETF